MPDEPKTSDGQNAATPASAAADRDLQAKCDEYLAGWKRALADYDNLKKNLASEKGELRRAVAEESVLRLVSVIDNFDQAVKHKPDAADAAVGAWLEGVLHVRTQLEDVLKDLGAEPFGRAGEAFDPSVCDAAGTGRDVSKPDDTVLEVVRRGWKMGERIVRPCVATVNKLEAHDEPASKDKSQM